MYPKFNTTTFAAEGLKKMKEGYFASRTLPSFINENFNAGLANEEIESIALVNSIKDDEYFAADELDGEKRSLSETGLDTDFLGNTMLRRSLGFLSDDEEMFLKNYADNTKPTTKNNFLKIMRGDTDEVLKQLKDKELNDANFEVFSYFTPTIDPETGTYKLKEVIGTKEAMAKVELAGSSIINSYGPKKLSENPLVSFGKGFTKGIHNILPGLYSFAAGVGDMAEATANLVQGNGFTANYDNLNALADYRQEELDQDVIYGTTTTQSEKGLLDNWEGFAGTMGQVFSSLTGYGIMGRAISGLGVGGLLGGFAAEGKAVDTLGGIAKTLNTALTKAPTAIPMLGAGMIMNYGEGYQAARQAGLSLEDAASVGMAVGAVNTFIEQNLGSNTLTRWLATGKSGEEAAKAIIRETGGDMSKLFDRGISNKILNSIMNTVDRITATGNKIGFGSMVEEGLEEFFQAQGKNSIEMLYDRFVAPDDVEIGKGKFGTDMFTKESFKSALEEGLAGAIGGMFGGIVHSRVKEDTSIIPFIASGEYETLQAGLNMAYSKGAISQQQYDGIRARAELLNNLYKDNKELFAQVAQYNAADQLAISEGIMKNLRDQDDYINNTQSGSEDDYNQFVNILNKSSHVQTKDGNSFRISTVDRFEESLRAAGRREEADIIKNSRNDAKAKVKQVSPKPKKFNDDAEKLAWLSINQQIEEQMYQFNAQKRINELRSRKVNGEITSLLNDNKELQNATSVFINSADFNSKFQEKIDAIKNSKTEQEIDNNLKEARNFITTELVKFNNNNSTVMNVDEWVNKEYALLNMQLDNIANEKKMKDYTLNTKWIKQQQTNIAKVFELERNLIKAQQRAEEAAKRAKKIKDYFSSDEYKAEMDNFINDDSISEEDRALYKAARDGDTTSQIEIAKRQKGEIIKELNATPVSNKEARENVKSKLDEQQEIIKYLEQKKKEEDEEIARSIPQPIDANFDGTKDSVVDKNGNAFTIDKKVTKRSDKYGFVYTIKDKDGNATEVKEKELLDHFIETSDGKSISLAQLASEQETAYKQQFKRRKINLKEGQDENYEIVNPKSKLRKDYDKDPTYADTIRLAADSKFEKIINDPRLDVSKLSIDLSISDNIEELNGYAKEKSAKKLFQKLIKTADPVASFNELSEVERDEFIQYLPIQGIITYKGYNNKVFTFSNASKLKTKLVLELLKNDGKVSLPEGSIIRTPGYNNYQANTSNSLITGLNLKLKNGEYVFPNGTPVRIGVADAAGGIMYIDPNDDTAEYLVTANAEGTPGSPYLVIPGNYQLTGEENYVAKLNPTKISQDLAAKLAQIFADIQLQKIKLSDKIPADNPYGIIPDKVGYLSYGEFLNYIVYFGENTVTSKREPSKILFFDYKDHGILKFGPKQEPLIPGNEESIASFVRWLTTNKNYSISRAFLNNDVPIKNGFKFSSGNTKLNFPTGGRYLNAVIENGLISTDLDIRKGLISKSYLVINNIPTSTAATRTVDNDPVVNKGGKTSNKTKAEEISVITADKGFKSNMENLDEGTTVVAKIPGNQKYANACGLVKTEKGFIGKSSGKELIITNLTDEEANKAIRAALVDDYNHYINGLIKYEEEHPEARETIDEGGKKIAVTKHGYLISTKKLVKNKFVENPDYYEKVKKVKIVPATETKSSSEGKRKANPEQKTKTANKSISSSNPFATLEQTEEVKRYSELWDRVVEGFNSIKNENLRTSAIRSLISNPSSASLKLLGITREEAYEFLDYTFPDGNTVSRLLLNGEKAGAATPVAEAPKQIKSPVKKSAEEKSEPKNEELGEITKNTSPFKLAPLAKDPQTFQNLTKKYGKEADEMSAEELRDLLRSLNEQIEDAIPGFEIYNNIRKGTLGLREKKDKNSKQKTEASVTETAVVNTPLTAKELAAKAGITPEETGEKRKVRKASGKFGGGKRSKPAAPMLVRENEKRIYDLNREIRLYRQMLSKRAGGNISVVNKLISIIGETGRPGWAWSIMNEDGVTLFENPAEGATYHEAFHRVSLLLLTPEERSKLYKMARKEYSLYNRSDNEVEEFLAEQFRMSVLENTPEIKGFVSRILSNIKSFVKTFLGINKTKIDNIDGFFNAIKNGKYKYARVNKESLTAFNNRYANADAPLTVNGITLHNIYNSALLNNIVSTLTSMTIDVNGIQNIESLEKGLSFQAVKDQIMNLRDKYEIAAQNESFTEWEKAAYQEKVDLYNEILDNFSTVFRPLIDTKLQGFNIRRVETKLEGKDDLNDLVNDEIRSAYEFSVKENAQADIRVMFLTLKKSDEYDPDTFLPQYVNPDVAWFNTFSAVHNAKSIDEMIEILAKKADETNTIRQAKGDSSKTNMYSELYDILTAKDEDGNVDEMLKTRFWNTFKKHRNQFINAYFANEVGETGKKVASYDMYFGDADVNKRSNKIEQNWSALFAINGTFADKEKLQNAITEYKALAAKTKKNTFLKTPYEENAMELVRILNSIDIVVDLDTIGILLNTHYFNSNLNIALKNLINGIAKRGFKDPVGLNNLFGENGLLQSLIESDIEDVQDKALNLFDSEKSVIELARSYVAANPTAEDDSVIGPDGSLVYAYSENNTITSMFEEWLKDEDFYTQMKQVTYSKSSYWLEQMADPKVRNNIHVETMLSMIATDEYDTGRGYLDIAPNEDLLLKFNATLNNKMPLPTLANKRTYYFISGLKRVPVSIQNGQLNSEAIDVFVNYAINEYVVIQEAIKAKNKFLDRLGVSEDAWNNMSSKEQKALLKEKNTNYKELVENYHYIVKNGAMKLTGNGYKLRYFPSLNDKLDDAKFWDTNNEKLRNSINKHLVQQVNNTIKLFINQKLIRGNSKYNDAENIKEEDNSRINIKAILGNTLLPSRLIKGKKTERDDLATAIADYAINNAVSTLEFEKLVSGDVAYYKGSKDYQAMLDDRVKRYSALTSTKSILRETWPAEFLDFDTHKYRTSVFSSNIIKSQVMYDEMMAKYVGTDDNHGLLWKQFEKFRKEGVGRFASMTDEQLKEEVVKEAEKRLGNYLHTDQTDAQVLISPKMFRKLAIMNGEWNDEKEEAYELMESDEPLSLEEELQAYSVIMQPLKYIHFGYDFVNGLQIPIYDKMSLATVFKRVANGRDLQKVREFMDNNDVDMIKFETAVKSGLRQKGTFYEDNKPTEDLNDTPIFEQSFKYLGKQLVTDPHHVSRIAVGTQMVKIGVAGVEDDTVYEFDGKQYTGAQLINDYVEAIARLSDLGRERILSDFGLTEITTDGKTYVSIDRDKFVQMLKDDAINSNMPSNLIDSLKTIENEDGSIDYYINLSGLPALSWIQSRIVSMIKKETIDVNTPGGSMIQMSNFAFKDSYAEVDVSEYEYKFNKELRFKDEHNRLEAVVSINLFKDVLPKQYLIEEAKKNGTTYFDEARKFILDNPDLAALSYRIPTQGMNSTLPITIVDVLPANVGDTIILPAELTTLTGAD